MHACKIKRRLEKKKNIKMKKGVWNTHTTEERESQAIRFPYKKALMEMKPHVSMHVNDTMTMM